MSAVPVHILALDDDPALLAVLEVSLRMCGEECDVTAVSTPGEALEALRARPIQLFVTDYALNDPEHNGLDMLRASQTLASPPRVIIITAFATLQITIDAIKLGCYDFLTKPFQIEELQLVVRNAVAQIRYEAQNRELRRQVTELTATVDEMAMRQREMLEKLNSLAETYGAAKSDLPELPAMASLNGAAVLGVQRRQAREKLSGYARMAEGLLTEVRHKQTQLQILYETGCLAEDDYKRLMAGRMQAQQ
ncbi:MAG: response regulator [Candidatus Sumerlaeia bacterium]